MERRARMDDLTGLLNRREVFDRLESLINTGVTGGGPHLAVCFIDVDDFKSYNDSFGHHIGDDILRNLATDVRAVLRAGDLAARVGGDEVLVVLSGSPPRSRRSSWPRRFARGKRRAALTARICRFGSASGWRWPSRGERRRRGGASRSRHVSGESLRRQPGRGCLGGAQERYCLTFQVMLPLLSVTVTSTVPFCCSPAAVVPLTEQSNVVWGLAT